MPKIVLLNEYTACRIAAGEVIERPASIVKELVENSLDAGAGLVNISITGGGTETIEVVDNGCGISQEDTPLAFQRHATSKIRSAADLENIDTLGFRGEALPSIAAISHLSVKTRVSGKNEGYHMVIKGGQVLQEGPVGCRVGTMISVRDIFFNTPARRKHLKSKSTEGGLIADLIYKMALTRPQTKLIFNHNGREIFRSPGSGRLIDVLASVYDMRAVDMMLAMNGENAGVKVEGFISKPELSRSTRQQITVAVNGRVVRSAAVNAALDEAYRGKLTVGRYPVAVILIRLEPGKIDVNVHPAKMEIKMDNEEQIQSLVTTAVRAALRDTDLIPRRTKLPADSEPYKLSFPASVSQYSIPRESPVEVRKIMAEANVEANNEEVGQKITEGHASSTTSALHKDDGRKQRDRQPIRAAAVSNKNCPPARLAEVAGNYKENPSFPDLWIIGQLMNAYILTQTSNGLFIVDQHAAHERIMYEKFFYKLTMMVPEVQYLLTPVNINLRMPEKELLKEYAADLQAVGFVFEEFGRDSILLRGIPADLSPGQSEGLITDVVEAIMEFGKVSDTETKHTLASLLACKAAIKAGEKLSMEAMQTLLAQLAMADEPYTCPHGRPTMVSFTRRELDVMFKRT
ncbi:DNA mismatch repair endonuclease MutL [Desulfoscipio sp. XC116]|uniref:DNA mismatch repair endonuclease MutL n=1 Tax=Desulfoscipio sp. XC116 TaxID=3144975 RepID=UPI00325BFADE